MFGSRRGCVQGARLRLTLPLIRLKGARRGIGIQMAGSGIGIRIGPSVGRNLPILVKRSLVKSPNLGLFKLLIISLIGLVIILMHAAKEIVHERGISILAPLAFILYYTRIMVVIKIRLAYFEKAYIIKN